MWGLAYSGIKNRLLSCSADGTVKLWNPAEKSPCISTFNTNRGEHAPRRAPGSPLTSDLSVPVEHGVPTSVDFNGCDPAHMVVSFTSGDVAVYDLETGQSVLVLKGPGEGGHTHTLSRARTHTLRPSVCVCVPQLRQRLLTSTRS